ncbi:NADH:flavin oxidoreductase [Aquisediminimonas profunda]|uniref:NADH:flavin oxidoreductase n=1 Tax=Aquisediminimonas profunda TaxID=1550733 RepID=UPI001C6329D2|nr:NADH:flavin oxidoreductase [Aquisediminimonas profunda]
MNNDTRSILFEPVNIGKLELSNRIVMAPMTRGFSPNGIPGQNVIDYYRRRAEGGVGLIITEGTWIPHWSSSNNPNVPDFFGDEALAGWKRVADAVHAAGSKIMPQLWHVGQFGSAGSPNAPEGAPKTRQIGPSGMIGELGTPVEMLDVPATQKDIDEVSEAYVVAAESAQHLGFDGVEIHAAHGYLLDQFFWSATNLRDDKYGGATLVERARIALDIVREMRRRTGPEFPIVMRISQWKQQDYAARLAETPEELGSFVGPLADAGVDIFHCSQRRFWEGEFGTDMNVAGWVKKLSGKPSITVGSVTLQQDMLETFAGERNVSSSNIGKLCELLARGDFDLVAIGRALIADSEWAEKVHRHADSELKIFSLEMLGGLE